MPRLAFAAATLIALAGAAPAAGPAQREYDSTRRALAGLTAGEPTACITLSRTRSSRYLDKDTIVYRDTARRYYVNRTSAGCDFDTNVTIITVVPTDRLCRGDSVRLVEQGSQIPRATCILGDFVPYTR